MDPLKEVQASTCNQVTTKLVACSSSLDPKAERYRALDGLRGIAALWITLYHSFLFSKASNVRLAGSILIPFFFVLSGFSLGITEGKPRCAHPSITSKCPSPLGSDFAYLRWDQSMAGCLVGCALSRYSRGPTKGGFFGISCAAWWVM